jgi:hypothetical protein
MSCRRMARKLSCMRAKNVQVPAQASQSRQTRTRAAVDIPESSQARRRDEDNDDDDIHDPTYGQEELTGSQLEDAPEGTQTQVRVNQVRE